MPFSAASRAGLRASSGTLLLMGAFVAGLPVLRFVPARRSAPSFSSTEEEPDLVFMMPRAMRGVGSAGQQTIGRGSSSAALSSTTTSPSTGVGAFLAAGLVSTALMATRRGGVHGILLRAETLTRKGKARTSERQKPRSRGTTPKSSRQQPKRMDAKFKIGDMSNMLNEEIEGVVVNLADFGIFIDIGVAGMNALAPKFHLPDGKLPTDFSRGQKVQCRVVETNEAKKRIIVSLEAPINYERGDSVCGKVTAINEKYILVKVPGLSSTSISWRNQLEKDPAEYEVGEEFVAQVLEVVPEKNSVVLTQMPVVFDEESRPERMDAKFDIGDMSNMLNEEIEGVVVGVVKFGIFIDIGVEGMTALAPNLHLPDGKLPTDFSPGEKLQCRVVETNEAEKRITVSLEAPIHYKRGESVCGKVTAINENHVLIKLPGLSMPCISWRSQLEKDPSEYEVGEEFVAKVIDIHQEKTQMRLVLDESRPQRTDARVEARDVFKPPPR